MEIRLFIAYGLIALLVAALAAFIILARIRAKRRHAMRGQRNWTR